MKNFTKQSILAGLLVLPAFLAAQWTEVASYPSTATDGAFTFTINGKAYVGGGLADERLHVYDPSADSWTRLADVPGQGDIRAWAFSFNVNGKGYVSGGSYETASDLNSDLWEYDPLEDSWTQKSDFPGGVRDGGYSFSIGNKGYMGGGFDGQYLNNDFYEYDPYTDSWTQLADFPGGPVIFPASFVINGKAYVGTGGQGANEIQGLWEFDPATAAWKKMADFAGAKRQTAVGFAIGNKGYIGGGMSEYKTARKDFWEFDPVQNTWSLVNNAAFSHNITAWSTAFALGSDVYFGLGVELPDFNFSNKFYKNTFSPGTGFAEEVDFTSGITLYPVPAVYKLNILSDEGTEVVEVKLFDSKGKKLAEFSGKEYDLTAFAPGIYVARIQTNQGLVSKKFIKE